MRRNVTTTRQRGAALIDLVVTFAVLAIVSAIAVPSFQAARARDETRLAARYLATRIQMLRVQALRRNQMLALRFDPDNPGALAAYEDGDADGVLQRDIDRGVDLPLEPSSRLADHFANVALTIREDVPAPDGGGVVPAGSDPVRIGATSLMSFGPLGTATGGTIYLAARSGPQMCVRVLGTTGRVRVLWYDEGGGLWRAD